MLYRLASIAVLLLASSALLAEEPKAAPATQPMDFRKLKEVMPEKLAGHERQKHEGEKVAAGEMAFSVARAEYGPKEPAENSPSIRLEVIDYAATPTMAQAATAWQNLSIDRESDSGYERTTKIADNPAFETFEKESKSGQIQLFVGKRYYLNVQTQNLSPEEIKKVADELPIKKFAELK